MLGIEGQAQRCTYWWRLQQAWMESFLFSFGAWFFDAGKKQIWVMLARSKLVGFDAGKLNAIVRILWPWDLEWHISHMAMCKWGVFAPLGPMLAR